MDGDVWFFDLVAPAYDRLMPPADGEILSAALGRADRGVERVVDVGGGTGRAIRAVSAPERIVVDASRAMLGRVPDGVGAVRGSATDLPVAGASVDAVLIVDALHHLPDAADVLAEAWRALRPGGVLVVREFDRTTLRGRLLEAGEAALGFDSEFFDADGLADRLVAAGFETTVMERGFTVTLVGRKPGGAYKDGCE